MASIYKRSRGSNYIADWTDHEGKRCTKSTKTSDKAAAERIAAKWEAAAALRRDGVIDPREDRYSHEARRPIKEHLENFLTDLAARDNSAQHVSETRYKCEAVIAHAKAKYISDLTAPAVQKAIAAIRDNVGGESRGLTTCNHYLTAIKGLTRWLTREAKVIREDQLECLKKFNAETDRRHIRRVFTADEMTTLLVSTRKRTDQSHALDGETRAVVYQLANGTGYRGSELRELTPASFQLTDLDNATVTAKAGCVKNRKLAVQPISRALAETLKAWLVGKAKGKFVFQGLPKKLCRMLKADLKAARAEWLKAAEDDKAEHKRRQASDFLKYKNAEGEVIDFHAYRHTYITNVIDSGASVKVAQELARHSTPTLTIGRYGHTRIADLRAAVSALPTYESATKVVESDPEKRQRKRQCLAVETAHNGDLPCNSTQTASGEPAGRKSLSDKAKHDAELHRVAEYPQGDSNPCYRTENPGSWATRRWGRAVKIGGRTAVRTDHYLAMAMANCQPTRDTDSQSKWPQVSNYPALLAAVAPGVGGSTPSVRLRWLAARALIPRSTAPGLSPFDGGPR